MLLSYSNLSEKIFKILKANRYAFDTDEENSKHNFRVSSIMASFWQVKHFALMPWSLCDLRLSSVFRLQVTFLKNGTKSFPKFTLEIKIWRTDELRTRLVSCWESFLLYTGTPDYKVHKKIETEKTKTYYTSF